MPAAAWAAKSGDAVLFAERGRAARRRPGRRSAARAARHLRARPAERRSPTKVERQLRKLGHGQADPAATPVENAIAFARYSDGAFGWGVRDPGPRPRVRERGPPAGRSGRGGALRRAVSTGRCCCSTPRRAAAARSRTTCSTSSPATGSIPSAASTITPGSWATSPRSASPCRPDRRADRDRAHGRTSRSARERRRATRPARARAPRHGRGHARAGRPGDAPLRASDPRPRRAPDRGPPPDDPARIEGERAIARLERIASEGQAEGHVQEHEQPLPSLRLAGAPTTGGLERAERAAPALRPRAPRDADPTRDGYLDVLAARPRPAGDRVSEPDAAGAVSRVYERWWRRRSAGSRRARRPRDGRRTPDRAAAARPRRPATASSTSPAGPATSRATSPAPSATTGLVVGIDASRPMLERAVRDTGAAGVDNLCFVRGTRRRCRFATRRSTPPAALRR